MANMALCLPALSKQGSHIKLGQLYLHMHAVDDACISYERDQTSS
jgi:hypothetical protein